MVNKFNHNSNKLWIDEGRELYKKLMQEWLGNNYILMNFSQNEGNSLNAERSIKTLKSKICKK